MTGGAKRDGFLVARMLSDIVSWPGDKGNQRDKHCIQPGTYFGMLIMFSVRDGMPAAFINDGFLQHMRVAAGAGLGVKYLARQDSHVVGMIGSGDMARTTWKPLRPCGRSPKLRSTVRVRPTPSFTPMK
jgi:alanine dehydrogenase